MSLEYRIGDVFERMAEIPDGSIDLITLLALSAEWGRVLAPHGSLCVELGDTYSGSGGAGGDYSAGGLRDGQEAFKGSAKRRRKDNGYPERDDTPRPPRNGRRSRAADEEAGILAPRGRPGPSERDRMPGWPLAKSLTGIPTLYPWSLAYGRNLLTGQPSPAGQWRIRNIIVWARPNPPVGALGDKFRPATSYITVACRSARRYFDLDAVRTEPVRDYSREKRSLQEEHSVNHGWGVSHSAGLVGDQLNPAGAPPLDWHTDHHPEDGDWLWKLSTQPYSGSHYATFPMALPKRLIEAMCPLRICTVCGKPSERIVGEAEYVNGKTGKPATTLHFREGVSVDGQGNSRNTDGQGDRAATKIAPTLGWSDCGHDAWRTGVVLDPFCGSGTTMEAAQAVGRHAIGIDLDHRNADLARSRVGMFLDVEGAA
jgi:hypothetical protein